MQKRGLMACVLHLFGQDFGANRRPDMPGLSLTRRASLLAAPAILAFGHGRAAELKKVAFTLPFLPEGPNLIAFVAKANGYWAGEGLDVDIARGFGSVAAAQAIGAGRFEYGMAAAPAGLQQAAKGLKIIQIACCSYDAMMGITVLADSPVHTAKDLAGRKIASTPTSGEYPFLPAYAQATGLDLSGVTVSTVDNNVRTRLLLEHQVDAISGFANTLVPIFTAQGVKSRSLLYSDAGLAFYGNTLMTQPERLSSEPKVAAGMVRGLMRATKFTLLQPEDALKIFLKAVPEAALSKTAAEQARIGLGMYRLAATAAKAHSHAIGWSDPADYDAMMDLTMKYLAAPEDKRPAAAALFTNDLIGSETMTAAEWAAAAASAQEFKAMLA
jgi:ABC-type nitrate/sulfonate/bicarbonate transport system substrate-binding protein